MQKTFQQRWRWSIHQRSTSLRRGKTILKVVVINQMRSSMLRKRCIWMRWHLSIPNARGDPSHLTYSSAKRSARNWRRIMLSGTQLRSWNRSVFSGRGCLSKPSWISKSNLRKTGRDMRASVKSLRRRSTIRTMRMSAACSTHSLKRSRTGPRSFSTTKT